MADEQSLSESPLTPAVLRGLGDRAYEKRKAAALDVTSFIKSFLEQKDYERINQVLNLLAKDFIRSRNVHHRKGGLIGLAAAAIGLSNEIENYLNILILSVLECFDDAESRVCYYACESLYNISKVARIRVLKYFNQIFEGLCKLFAHVDVGVKNGANLLDRLIKDIVTEAETFELETFMPILQKNIKLNKPYIRQLLVSWIAVLDAVPDINMLDYLPDFLDGLFNMLSDSHKEISEAADKQLSEFLNEIKKAEILDFGPMISILVQQSYSKEKSNRHTAIIWINDFIKLGGFKLKDFYAQLLGSLMHCISDVDQDIRKAAQNANQILLSLVKKTEDALEFNLLLFTLIAELKSEFVSTRVAVLQWIDMLHQKDSLAINQSINELLPALLKTISDPADEVVLINLQVLARISQDDLQFQRVLNALIVLFIDDRALLETRGALVIRKLASLLNPRDTYISLAEILNSINDLEFVSLMVQTLNLILLTAPELTPLRKALKEVSQTSNESDKQMFVAIFGCWVHNPVATLSLCLLSQAYSLSSCLIQKFADVNVSVGFLMQVDKLVQLLESPIFIHLRLQLLESNARDQGHLLKTLYGLLMLLPQSQAYKTLSDRLMTVSSLHMFLGSRISTISSSDNLFEQDSNFVNFEDLLKRFESIQEKHTEYRMELLQNRSIISKSFKVEESKLISE